MTVQLQFISIILRRIEEKQRLYAADILIQLYRKRHTHLSIGELISFFRNHNTLLAWEAIMSLKDLAYIESTFKNECNKPLECFRITKSGISKVQMIQACFHVGHRNYCINNKYS